MIYMKCELYLLNDDIETLKQMIQNWLAASYVIIPGLLQQDIILLHRFNIHRQLNCFRVKFRVYQIALRQHLAEKVNKS